MPSALLLVVLVIVVVYLLAGAFRYLRQALSRRGRRRRP
jgi:hypothetical protein